MICFITILEEIVPILFRTIDNKEFLNILLINSAENLSY